MPTKKKERWFYSTDNGEFYSEEDLELLMEDEEFSITFSDKSVFIEVIKPEYTEIIVESKLTIG